MDLSRANDTNVGTRILTVVTVLYTLALWTFAGWLIATDYRAPTAPASVGEPLRQPSP